MTDHILKLTCDDRPGITASVATRIAECGGNITEAQQFNDAETGRFFMRTAFAMEGGARDLHGDSCRYAGGPGDEGAGHRAAGSGAGGDAAPAEPGADQWPKTVVFSK
jgi:hypothetical protein